LPDALRRLTESGYKFKPGEVLEWLDCGNKEVTVHTNQRVLEYDFEKNVKMVADSAKIADSVIIPPCFIGENVLIENAVVGPHVSLGNGTKVIASVVRNTIVQNHSTIHNVVLADAMIGAHASCESNPNDLSLGDFSTVKI
jgi:glucose-1-phosphate thymidylyltransferase